MSEKYVQVPVSLIEGHSAFLDRAGYTATAAQFRALLSQPTPTAEPEKIAHEYEQGRFGDDGVCHARLGSPVYGRCYLPRSRHVDPSTIRDVIPPTLST